MLDLRRGDIVALQRGGVFDEIMGVVTYVSTRTVRVTYGNDLPDSVYQTATGLSLHDAKRAKNWLIRPLDALTRHDIVAWGVIAGKVSRAKLARMEAQARSLRLEIMKERV